MERQRGEGGSRQAWQGWVLLQLVQVRRSWHRGGLGVCERASEVGAQAGQRVQVHGCRSDTASTHQPL